MTQENCKNCGASMGQYSVCQYCAPNVVMVKYKTIDGSVGDAIIDGICDAECEGIKPTRAVLNPLAYAELVSSIKDITFRLPNISGSFKLLPSEKLFCYGVSIIQDEEQIEAVVIC